MAHRRRRLDRNDRGDERDEQTRELTGTRGKVQGSAVSGEPKLGRERIRHGARVARPPAFVDQRGSKIRTEAPLHQWLELHQSRSSHPARTASRAWQERPAEGNALLLCLSAVAPSLRSSDNARGTFLPIATWRGGARVRPPPRRGWPPLR